MKKHLVFPILAATALLLGGCLPDQFIWWSPDGQIAAVRTPDGLRLTDTNGQLSAIVLPGTIHSAAWASDGSTLVVSRSFEVNRWSEAEKLIPTQEAATTRHLARSMPDLLKGGLNAAEGSFEQLDAKFLAPLGLAESQALLPAWACALDVYPEQIRAAIAGFTNASALEAEIFSTQTNGVHVSEISLLTIRNGRPEKEVRALRRSLQHIAEAILSPHHPVVAFRTEAGALRAISMDGQRSVDVSEEDVTCMAWSADGRSLFHVAMKKGDKSGEIRSRAVIAENGELLQNPPGTETLALAAFVGTAPRICVLPDRRLLFASVPITLPAPTSVRLSAQFFLLDPAKPEAAPVPVSIKEGSLPDDLSAFAASPDGRYVAMVEGATDVVAVLELATGKVQIISPPHNNWKSRMIPAWKTARELSFAAVPSATATRPELVLWQAEGPWSSVSKNWPNAIVNQWMEGPSNEGAASAK